MIIFLLSFGCKKEEYFFNPPGNGEDGQQTIHVLDGVNDFSDDQVVGIDQVGDISERSLDLDTLWAVKDDSMLYIGFNAHSEPNYGMAYGIYIFTDSIVGSGATSDPWNRLVNYEGGIYPPFVLYFWHDVNSITSAQFIRFDGSWSYMDLDSEYFVYNGELDFLEVFIPLDWLGYPDSIFIELFTTGGANTHPQDTSPEDDNVQYPEPDWTDTTVSLSVAVPVK